MNDGRQQGDPGAARRPLPWPVRALLIGIAAISLATGIVGLFVPGLPTTVFVLLAAACAARGSPRFHGWLLSHRVFGPIIVNWENGGRVSRPAKRAAALTMAISAAVLLVFVGTPWSLAPIAIMAVVLIWLWQRPEA